MERIVKGLEGVSKVLDSTSSLLETIENIETDEKQKEDGTQELIQRIMDGDVSQENLERLMQEEKVEVNEEDKMVKFLNQLVKGEGEAIQNLENITSAVGQEENQADQKLQNITNMLSQIEGDGSVSLTVESLNQVFGESKEAADMILDEADEELRESNLMEKLSQELGYTAEEFINSEKLELEEEQEEREIEEISQRIHNQQLNDLIHELEQHTSRDEQQTEEGRKQLINLIEEAEATDEELEAETKHTYDEAEQLLEVLREIQRLTQNAGMQNQDFQEGFENLMNEVGQAEDEAQEAAENEQEAEQTEEKAEEIAENPPN